MNQENRENLILKDEQLLSEIESKLALQQSPQQQNAGDKGRKFRNHSISKLAETGVRRRSELIAIFELLKNNQTFDLNTEEHTWQDIDGETQKLTINRASKTKMWPMGTNFWVRDNAIIATRLLSQNLIPEYNELGKKLLLSNLTIMSSLSQLKRMEGIIASKLNPKNPNNWPHIFLSIQDNLNAEKTESWMHQQDAWQFLAYYVLDALLNGLITIDELSNKQIKFLSLIIPFQASIKYYQFENGGSWEELTAVRSSVICWDVAVIDQIIKLADHPGFEFILAEYNNYQKNNSITESFLEFSTNLKNQGLQTLAKNFPFESPGYSQEDPRYREADAALIYLMISDIADNIPNLSADYVEEITKQIKRLEGDHGIKRYLGDSYQGLNYFTNTTTNNLKQALSGDSSGVDDFIFRAKTVEVGYEAEWTHFVWQLSYVYGELYQTEKSKEYLEIQKEYFLKGLSLITGQNEVSIHQNEDQECEVIEIPEYQIPECYIALRIKDQIKYIPSPHTPLYWSVAECLKAFNCLNENLN